MVQIGGPSLVVAQDCLEYHVYRQKSTHGHDIWTWASERYCRKLVAAVVVARITVEKHGVGFEGQHIPEVEVRLSKRPAEDEAPL